MVLYAACDKIPPTVVPCHLVPTMLWQGMAGKKSPSCFLASKFSPLTSAGPWDYSFVEVKYHTLSFLLFCPLIRLLWESSVPEKMARPKSQTLYRVIAPFFKLSCLCLGRLPENVFVWSYVHPLPYMSWYIMTVSAYPGTLSHRACG